MERSLTVDLPVEQVAKVVKRHLVIQPTRSQHDSSSGSAAPIASQNTSSNKTIKSSRSHKNTHHLLPGGAIADEIYKWTARVENEQQWRRQRAESISLPAIRPSVSDPLLQSLKQPGGFRRHYVLTKAARQGKTPPNFLTSSFVEFLCLYGHFGGEDLSDDDDESSLSSWSSLSNTSGDEEQNSGLHHRHHHRHHYHPHHQQREEIAEEEEGMAYRGNNMISRASYQSINHRHHHHQRQQQHPTTTTTTTSDNISHSSGIKSNNNNNNVNYNSINNHSSNNSNSNNNLTASSGEPSLPFPASTSSTKKYPVQYHQLQARETMPLMSRSRPGQTLQGKATPGKAMFLLLKSFVTTGIMFLPKAYILQWRLVIFHCRYYYMVIDIFMVLFIVGSNTTCGPCKFWRYGWGLIWPKMKMAVLVAITLSQIGFVCAYMVFVAENLQSLILAFSKCRVLLPMHLLILAQSFAFIPLAMIRKIQRLSIFALIADVFIVIGLLYLFYYDLKELVTIGVGDVTMFWNPIHFPLFIGTVAFTYEGIGLVIPITESMKEPQKFPAFGEDVQTIILLNLPSKDPMVSSIQTLYSLAICLSIPLQLFPAIRIMENGLFTTRSGKNNAVVKWQKNVFRVLIVFLCAWIAIVGSRDKLDKFVSLIGALFSLSLPPIRRAADIALIAFGIFGNVFNIVFFISMSFYLKRHDCISMEFRDIIDPIKSCIAHRT
ncbi:transmembrane amino acid transporter protein-domain-containing protein [Circinella umbellata]|nr:transmembrane amino acid transporter protein-domain-containing protein [Circinella umbellata]